MQQWQLECQTKSSRVASPIQTKLTFSLSEKAINASLTEAQRAELRTYLQTGSLRQSAEHLHANVTFLSQKRSEDEQFWSTSIFRALAVTVGPAKTLLHCLEDYVSEAATAVRCMHNDGRLSVSLLHMNFLDIVNAQHLEYSKLKSLSEFYVFVGSSSSTDRSQSSPIKQFDVVDVSNLGDFEGAAAVLLTAAILVKSDGRILMQFMHEPETVSAEAMCKSTLGCNLETLQVVLGLRLITFEHGQPQKFVRTEWRPQRKDTGCVQALSTADVLRLAAFSCSAEKESMSFSCKSLSVAVLGHLELIRRGQDTNALREYFKSQKKLYSFDAHCKFYANEAVVFTVKIPYKLHAMLTKSASRFDPAILLFSNEMLMVDSTKSKSTTAVAEDKFVSEAEAMKTRLQRPKGILPSDLALVQSFVLQQTIPLEDPSILGTVDCIHLDLEKRQIHFVGTHNLEAHGKFVTIAFVTDDGVKMTGESMPVSDIIDGQLPLRC